MIVFRADGNPVIGTGHVMRCLSLAKEMVKRGVRCQFIVAENYLEKLIKQHGLSCVVLHADYRAMERELQWWGEQVWHEPVEQIIVDSYFVTQYYLAELRRLCKTVYIDDLMENAYPVDTLINYNIYSYQAQYEKLYQGKGIKTPIFLLGPGYAPLREEFDNIPARKTTKKVQNILISTGGADLENLAMQILQQLKKSIVLQEVCFHVIVGTLNPHKEELKEFSEENPRVILHFDVSAMAELMRSCDIAVSAAGSTLYELCACGVPTVTYISADNQVLGAEAFHEQGLIYNAGDGRKDLRGCLNRIVKQIEMLVEAPEICDMLAQKQKALINGSGTQRLVQALLS